MWTADINTFNTYNPKKMSDLILKMSFTINAPKSKVWDALTNPDMIKKYFFGTEMVTDWRVGSSIYWRGEWEGKKYEDKGHVLEFEKEKMLKYNYWSSFSTEKDEPANYSNITYAVAENDATTVFSLTQDNFKTKEARDHSEGNWNMIIKTMKEMLEG